MRVEDIMATEPACCTPETGLQRVAQMMIEHDCGAIPVIDNLEDRKPLGIITDRDITCRAVAGGKNPLLLKAADCMTRHLETVQPHTKLKECCEIMERAQVRRLPVVDDEGRCCGIVSQANIALHCPQKTTAEVVREVSQQHVEA